jgi:hypothetical protein
MYKEKETFKTIKNEFDELTNDMLHILAEDIRYIKTDDEDDEVYFWYDESKRNFSVSIHNKSNGKEDRLIGYYLTPDELDKVLCTLQEFSDYIYKKN